MKIGMSMVDIVLPHPSTGLAEDPVLSFDGADLRIMFRFGRAVSPDAFEVTFERTRSFVYRAEPLCSAQVYEIGYDRVGEINRSDWVAALASFELPHHESREEHHFVLSVDSWGCIEVVASACRST